MPEAGSEQAKLDLVEAMEGEGNGSVLTIEWSEMMPKEAPLDVALRLAFNSIVQRIYEEVSAKLEAQFISTLKDKMGDIANQQINRIRRQCSGSDDLYNLQRRVESLEDEAVSYDYIRDVVDERVSSVARDEVQDAIQDLDFVSEQDMDGMIQAAVDSAKDSLYDELTDDLETFIQDKMPVSTDKAAFQSFAELADLNKKAVDQLRDRIEGLENMSDLDALKQRYDAIIEDLNKMGVRVIEVHEMASETSSALHEVGNHLSRAGGAAQV